MNGTDRLERELTAWFGDAAAPRVPDYTPDIVRATATMRQRPRWSFLTRWLPAGLIPRLPHMTVRRVPWRAIALLAVLGLLLAATLTLYLGSPPRVPPPFGPAENGLVTYAEDGDIWTVDPVTAERRAIVAGLETDLAPRWSRDGTRVAFLREVIPRHHLLVVANGDGSDVVESGASFVEADIDSIVWSPNGRWVAVAAGPATGRTMSLIDTSTGEVRELDTPDIDVEMYWRPPDGRQLMYVRAIGDDRQLVLVDVLDAEVKTAPLGKPELGLRPGGWTPDGERFVVHHWPGEVPYTSLLDPETGQEERLEIAFGRMSNDGMRMVGYGDFFRDPFLCVMSLPDGECVPIAEGDLLPDWEHTAGLHWSPDDRWIVVYPQDDRGWVLLDPETGTPIEPAWSDRGVESWQRVAPPAWWE
jgi:dipeptidyl aminopeptidase/acylaminoacyl peptidase